MEKTCEFCGSLRPIVYCQADGAFLCLSCDAKVHSANALSSRHSRTLLCDSCRYNQAHVRCLDHLMLLCRGCDSRLHKAAPQHRKLMISSFTGSPSAKHFAALWGFKANDLDDFSANNNEIGSVSCMSSDMVSAQSKSLGSAEDPIACDSSAGPEIGSSNSQQYQQQISYEKDQSNCLIMQQILDLKKLQLTDSDSQSPLLRRYDVTASSPSMNNKPGKLDEGLGKQLKELDGLANNLQCTDDSNQEVKGDQFPSPTPQLDHVTNSSTTGDSFWQSKNPLDTQFWSQNMQDLGVCEELGRFDNFNIPEVDVTFRNFEDLFNSDADLTQPLLDYHDLMWSEIEKETRQDISMAASFCAYKEANTSDHFANHLPWSMHNSNQIRSSNSASFTPSRLSNESSGSDYHDSGHSGSSARGVRYSGFTEVSGTEAEGAEHSMRSPRERKKTRMQGKQTQLSPRKGKADVHKRIKSRCLMVEGYESDAANVTKSY